MILHFIKQETRAKNVSDSHRSTAQLATEAEVHTLSPGAKVNPLFYNQVSLRFPHPPPFLSLLGSDIEKIIMLLCISALGTLVK